MKVKLSNELLGIAWEKSFKVGWSPGPEDVYSILRKIAEVLKEKGFKRKLTVEHGDLTKPGFIENRVLENGEWTRKAFEFYVKVSRKDAHKMLVNLLKKIGFEEVNDLVKRCNFNQFMNYKFFKNEVGIPFRVDVELTKEEMDLVKNARNLHEIQDLLYTISFFKEIRIGATGASKFLITLRKGKFGYVDLDFGGAYEHDISYFADWCEGKTQNCAEEVLNVLREVLKPVCKSIQKGKRGIK